jgi:hypothetical protein
MSQTKPAYPEPLQAKSITAQVLREDLWRRANNKDDWAVFVIVGREGSGKSLTCASILRAVDPTFGIDRSHFRAIPFLEDIGRDMDENGRGSMLDEAGVAFGNRTWQDREQVKANQYLQTARDDNRIIGLTLPRLSELDSQLEGRIHYLGEVTKCRDGEFVELKWKRIDPSRAGENKVYKKYPRVTVNGRTRKVERIRVGLPPQGFIEPYQAKKAQFKQELNEEVVGMYEPDEEDTTDELTEPKKIVEHILENEGVEPYIGNNNGQTYLDKDMIAYEYDLGGRKSKRVKKGLEREANHDDL